jgi:branched-chain amino acid transport system ATP-binding protein
MSQPASLEAAAPPLLEVEGLSKNFGGLRAISSVSFRVEEGEVVGVIGPNGAGKTTLFALLSGFLPPTSGSLSLAGRSLLGLRPDQRCHLGIARTFQVVRPFPEMTVLDNVRAGAVFNRPERRSRAEVRQQALEILEMTGLASLAQKYPPSLSLPQRKRLEVARAVATRPRLLLLDEVLAGLNPREVEGAIPFVRELNTRLGLTILMIEHNLRAIMGLSQRIMVLNFGQLIFNGTPQEAVQDENVIKAYLGEFEYA